MSNAIVVDGAAVGEVLGPLVDGLERVESVGRCAFFVTASGACVPFVFVGG